MATNNPNAAHHDTEPTNQPEAPQNKPRDPMNTDAEAERTTDSEEDGPYRSLWATAPDGFYTDSEDDCEAEGEEEEEEEGGGGEELSENERMMRRLKEMQALAEERARIEAKYYWHAARDERLRIFDGTRD
ncbi:hypothetical protein CROQUDRAFT_652514 [Cronartium quercuum f. sp. fusiforme G11]|uniref:Uncharacterized protein n=1 Tax=Cronartium quercuum f. sp. fusiforme G11 TaxID=708437 RepID=A0A9P6TFE5_9BASI|nr:hypothetical protein CROQUDRAFT_652514 [Cronartium quercuum f. sp. fusiforme G11]